MLTRRRFSLSAAALALTASARAAADLFAGLGEKIAALERASGGRLGVAALDTKSGRRAEYCGDEGFPMCSTFKLLAAAAVLARVDAGQTTLDRRIVYAEADLVPYSPVTKPHAGAGLSLAAICEAAVTQSDNTAGNLMLREIGGPAGFTQFARSLRDRETRLDRWETALNEAAPGDIRDTTTPRAMLDDLHKLAFGDTLKPASRETLAGWLKGCKTSADRMRAKLPAGWIVGDKTGAGGHGSMNDVGIIWPPDGAPILLAIYLTASEKSEAERAAVIQDVGRLVAAAARP